MSNTFEETVKIGSKGQFVIPASFRRATGIVPGSDAKVSLEDNEIRVRKPEEKTEEIFQRIALKGKSIGKIHPHESYEEELEERFAKLKGFKK